MFSGNLNLDELLDKSVKTFQYKIFNLSAAMQCKSRLHDRCSGAVIFNKTDF